MAFSFASSGPSAFGGHTGGSNNAQTQTGQDLLEIQTEALGFKAINGESKLRILPSPWPLDALPPPTASLLSIASNKGLLAVGGPESVIVATTESVVNGFSAQSSSGSYIKPFSPNLTLDVGTRISQVAFSADENFLVISAENGGGLAVYEVQALLQNNTQSTFQMSTNGIALRALTPNPHVEKAEFFAVVTANGELMIANMKTRQFLSGPNGQVMKDGVSCVSWSKRGVQLVAGLANGTAFQMTPEGEGKAEIPRPTTELEGDQHVSSISWLENHEFLMAHTPSSFDRDGAPPTSYTFVSRTPKAPPYTYTYQKLPEVCSPYGLNRSPPFQFIQRLKDFPPNIQEILIVASTASEEVGLFTKVAQPFDEGSPINVFTSTSLADSRRAAIPMTEDLSSMNSPIGMALDLSSKTKVSQPLSGGEPDESPTPLPALMILNNEGVLVGWWIVYNDSIQQGTMYSGLVAATGQQSQPVGHQSQQIARASTSTSSPQETKPAFGQSAFGQSAFGSSLSGGLFGGASNAPAAPAFGTTSIPNAGITSFGASSGLGGRQSPWGASATTSQANAPAFGKPAFGSSGGIGQKSSPWGAPATNTTTAIGSAFGQAGTLGARSGSAFGASGTNSIFGATPSVTAATAGSGGGFASFANTGGFMSVAQNTGESVLAKTTPNASFTSAMDMSSSFGATPSKPEPNSSNTFGMSSGFSIGSSWKKDATVNDNKPKPDDQPGPNLFNSGFGQSLGETLKSSTVPEVVEADMTSEQSDNERRPDSPKSPIVAETTTPADTPAPSKFFSAPPGTGGLFGTQAQSQVSPAVVGNSTPAPSISGNTLPASTTPVAQSPFIKSEPVDTPFGVSEGIPEAPLPPDTISKTTYTPSESSASSAPPSNATVSKVSNDAPLPPDFLKSKGKSAVLFEDVPSPFDSTASRTPNKASGDSPSKELALPPENEDEDKDLDDEGSGVDVGKELKDQSLDVTPQSSFGAPHEKSPPGLPGDSTTPQQAQPAKTLFGEVGKSSVPIFPPPTKTQESPRSPSPVRSTMPREPPRLSTRTASAPGPSSKVGGNQTASMGILLQQDRDQVAKRRAQRVAEEEQERNRIASKKAQRKAEEEQDLSDREDDKIREELSSEVKATLELEPFIAHHDYVAGITKPGIPGEIEKLYRDINSMIDTLGLNGHSLEAFIKGNCEMAKDSGRGVDDLESNEDWCLEEVKNLSDVEAVLETDLNNGRLNHVQEKLDSCQELRKDLERLRTKRKDIRTIVDAKNDQGRIEASRSIPLTAEQSLLQKDLRKDFTRFQKLLAEAEEGISMLRAKLASFDNGKKSNGMQKAPTVEAVEKTILKMTNMVEKRSGDIDVLETQMRKLNVLGSNVVSRESSPFVTPPTSARKSKGLLRTPASASSMNANMSFYTPKSEKSRFGNSFTSTANGATGAEKGQLTQDDIRRVGVKAKRRKEINGLLKEVLLQDGMKIRGLD